MTRIFFIVGLQLSAFIIAWMQYLVGVRTDEAKYLLNIPYPHPPLIRSVLSWTEGFIYQEIFWRIIFATLLIQGVWLVWDMGRSLSKPSRIVLALSWFLSSGVILQAGSLYMAPMTALQTILFLWLYERRELVERWPVIVGILWLCSLFTAYQGILLSPLILALLLRARCSWIERSLYFFLPLGLLCIYSLTNPLALASMVVHGSRDLSSDTIHRFLSTARVWVLSGSFIVSIVGTVGLFWSRRYGVIMTFILICAYVALSRYDYYMILFTPLVVYGVREVLHRCRYVVLHAFPYSCVLLLGFLIVIVQSQRPSFVHNPARSVMRMLDHELPKDSLVLIRGSFGHQWQYESLFPVQRYRDDLLSIARGVICLEECGRFGKDWKKVEVEGVNVFVSDKR